MKQGLLALAALLGLMTGLGRAEYIVIIIDLNAARPGQSGGGGNMGAMGGGTGILGTGGPGPTPGGMIGGPPTPGGPGAMGGGAQGNAGGFNFGLMGGGQPPRGNMGNTGTPPMGGALGIGGTPPMGGALGAPGGPGGPGIPGGPGFPGGPGYPGGSGNYGVMGGGVQEAIPPLRVMAVVEVSQRKAAIIDNMQLLRITHKWGQTIPTQGQWLMTRDNKHYPSTARRFEDEYAKVSKKGTAATTDDWLNLARWALEHDLLEPFTKVMDTLVKNDEKNPKVAAYSKVKEQIAKPLPGGEASAKWKKSLYTNAKIASRDHYDLIHWAPDEKAPEVKTRLDKLEDHFKGYYFWFALHGQVMPMPKEKMVAVLVQPGKVPGEEFYRQNKVFDSAPVNVDSFFARRHNLVVFSSTRLDEPYELLQKGTTDVWRLFDRDKALRGQDRDRPRGSTAAQVCIAQTYSLLMKAMEEDAERAAVGQQSTRQLIAASGLLPKNVHAPEWIQSGMGSLFETPQSSPWQGYGAPHWAHLFAIDELKKKDKDKDFKDPLTVLTKVVTDTYFRESLEKSKNHNGSVKARATAWALTYYLASEKPDALLKYYKELSKLPRDLDLEEKTLLDCFKRAFGNNLATLANEWARFIDNVHPDAEEILKELYKIQNELALEMRGDPNTPTGGGTTPTGPMGPMGPGPIGPGPIGPSGPMGPLPSKP